MLIDDIRLLVCLLVSLHRIRCRYFDQRIQFLVGSISEKCCVDIDAFSMSIIILAIETRFNRSISTRYYSKHLSK